MGGGYQDEAAYRGERAEGWGCGRGGVAALLLAGSGSYAQAQTFNDVIQGTLDNYCQGFLGPEFPPPPTLYQGTLSTICGGGGAAGAGTSAGASIASQALGQQGADQRRIQLRLEEQRQASREGGGLAASADPTFQLGKLGLFITARGTDQQERDALRVGVFVQRRRRDRRCGLPRHTVAHRLALPPWAPTAI
jgi:hypothetical protein